MPPMKLSSPGPAETVTGASTRQVRRLSLHTEAWTLREPFAFHGQRWQHCTIVLCEIGQDGLVGRGEGFGVFFAGETADTLIGQIESVARAIESGVGRQRLQSMLPPGGARNAVDCALWELESRLHGVSAWELAGVSPAPVRTVRNIGLHADPQQAADRAARDRDWPLLKVKLNADRPVERIAAIRRVRPDARILIDANQSWTLDRLRAWAPSLHDLGVEIIEQPLPRGADAVLEKYPAPIPLYADESCLHRGDLAEVARRYQGINIKLDKAGGLTEALQLARDAGQLGLALSVGTMFGTSYAMAAASVVAQLCAFGDLDAPAHMRYDRIDAISYEGGWARLPPQDGWGRP